MPIVVGGPSPVGIGLTDLPSIRAAGTYEDMRTGPHHVFRIEGEKIRILPIHTTYYITAFLKFLNE